MRFTSLSLENAYGQSTVETETDQSGLFSRNLLPGTWYAQFIPPYESDGGSSPEDIQIEVRNDNEVELGDIFLEERVLLEGYVVAPSGYPLGDVLINAVETGYNGYSYSATSGSDGYFSMRVPDVALSVSLQPSAADLAITRYELSDPNLAPAQFELSGGTLVAGHLVDPEGNPVPFTMIEVRDDSDWLYGVTLSGDDGYFEVRISQ